MTPTTLTKTFSFFANQYDITLSQDPTKPPVTYAIGCTWLIKAVTESDVTIFNGSNETFILSRDFFASNFLECGKHSIRHSLPLAFCLDSKEYSLARNQLETVLTLAPGRILHLFSIENINRFVLVYEYLFSKNITIILTRGQIRQYMN